MRDPPTMFLGLQFCFRTRRRMRRERELGPVEVLMFTTRLGQLSSLEQICSLMMFSASRINVYVFLTASHGQPGLNNKTSELQLHLRQSHFSSTDLLPPSRPGLGDERRLKKVTGASICIGVRYLTCMTQQYFTQRRLH